MRGFLLSVREWYSGHVHSDKSQQEHHYCASGWNDDGDVGHDGFNGVLRFMGLGVIL